MNSSTSNGVTEKLVADVGDRAQAWFLVYEDRFGGYLGQLVSRDESPVERIRLRNVLAYEHRLVVHGGPIVQGPGQAGILKGPAEDQRNVWDIDGLKFDEIVTVTHPALVIGLADASAETRTNMNQAITIIEQSRLAKISAQTGLDLSGKIDPALADPALAAKMKRPA